jgi:hypothetical protein
MSIEDLQFSDERFMTAAEKTEVLHAWVRFLKSGCDKTKFTKALYHHLTQHCSFIAHYDRNGFYDVYFGQVTPGSFRFLDQFDPQKQGISAEYGDTHWLSASNTGADLNEAMRDAAAPYVKSLRSHFQETQRQAELALAARLLEKHGLVAIPAITPPEDTVQASRGIQTANPAQQQLFVDG